MPGQVLALQVFNQYTEQGGEELWVDEMSRLGSSGLRIEGLRFLSRAWKSRGAPSRVDQAIRIWDNPQSRVQLRKRVERSRPDVLIFHNLIPVASFGMYREAAELGLPVIQYIHNFRPFSPSGTLWVNGRVDDSALKGDMIPEIVGKAWERSRLKTALLAFHLHRLMRSRSLDSVTLWVAVSEFMRQKFIEAGIPAGRIRTLRHCWRALPEAPTEQEGDYYLFLGRLVAEKGVETLLDAWEFLEEELGAACPRLVIAGTGPLERRVRKAAASSDRIDFHGFLSGEAKDRALRRCRGLLAPSVWWEPLGLIVYEAYDHARPVAVARSGGLTETVNEGVTGFMHGPGDPASLAGAIQRLESIGEAGRRQLGLAGRAWLLKEADPDRWRREFLGILKEAREARGKL